MGTEVCIKWKGLTKKEQWEVVCPHASINMVMENQFLHLVFPKKYWSSETTEYVEFDFNEEGYQKLQLLGLEYIKSILTKTDMPSLNKRGVNAQRDYVSNFLGVCKKSGWKNLNKQSAEYCSFPQGVEWLSSLFRFFELGMKKQEEGKKPKIYISGCC